jgi:YVTN family beta-propeller protein
MKALIRITLALSTAVLSNGALSGESVQLQPGSTVEIPHSTGKFDFLRIDSKRRRLLASHEKDGTADYIDLEKQTVIARLKVGGAVDTAIDTESKFYYVSVQEDKRVAVVEAESLNEVKSIPLAGPTDAILFEPKNRLVYVTHDDGTDVWVIDPVAAKVVATVKIPGAPEFMVYDEKADRVYLNIKNKDLVAVIDPATNSVIAQWPTAPATQPHGLALDSGGHRVFVAGGNGKLVVIDTQSGVAAGSVDIASKVDQIAFDAARELLYCAGANKMSIVSTAASSLAEVGSQATAATAKNVAVDPVSHAVWTTYTDGKDSYAKSWLPPKR